MTGFIMFIHAIICIVLVTVILMQSGRGGGLTESFSSAESMFGAQTNEFMIRATSILTVLFIVTCLSLAVISSKQGRSLMPEKTAVPVAPEVPALPQSEDATKDIIEKIPDKAPIGKSQP